MYLVIKLIVYADVLVFLNMLVDYFLLLATSKIVDKDFKTSRIAISSFLGGISALYIFLPQQNIFVDFVYKSATAFVLSAVCFESHTIKEYLKNTGVLFSVTCGYAGLMFALWNIFKPYGMVINNSVVYFDISPVILVCCSVGGYLIFTFLWKIFGKSAVYAEKCDITVCADGKNILLKAIADTGNSIEDVFGKNEIIIADKSAVERLFGKTDVYCNSNLKKRYRILPCSTVSGYDMLEGYRCDGAVLESGGKKTVLKKPVLAVSKVTLNDGYNAIVNPKILR